MVQRRLIASISRNDDNAMPIFKLQLCIQNCGQTAANKKLLIDSPYKNSSSSY